MANKYLTDHGFVIEAPSVKSAQAAASRVSFGEIVGDAPTEADFMIWSLIGPPSDTVRVAASHLMVARRGLRQAVDDMKKALDAVAKAEADVAIAKATKNDSSTPPATIKRRGATVA